MTNSTSFVEKAMGTGSKAWALIHEAEIKRGEGNPFRNVVSVDVVGHHYDVEDDEDMVELTIRIPEQFFTEKFPADSWEAEMAMRDLPGRGPEYLIDSWDIDVDRELYGPDGHQVPLW